MVSESFQDLGAGDAASTASTTASPAPGTASHPYAGAPGDPVSLALGQPMVGVRDGKRVRTPRGLWAETGGDPETETEVFDEGMRRGTGPVQGAPPGKRPAGPPFRRGTIHMLPGTCWTLEFRSVLCLPVRFGQSPQPPQTLLGGQTKRPGVWVPRSGGCKLRSPIRPSRENPRADMSSAPAFRDETGLWEGREQPSKPASRGRPRSDESLGAAGFPPRPPPPRAPSRPRHTGASELACGPSALPSLHHPPPFNFRDEASPPWNSTDIYQAAHCEPGTQ
ncbi:unnamed protein product [Rangifer tarandus platyrhynchus]|uniref:Uncharacterized protein n=1 Tax=Rangifer tarandus platyrhynchus TaxID=3082113 RepID=A0AC59Y528_RANTA